jgi:hypothetical protein
LKTRSTISNTQKTHNEHQESRQPGHRNSLRLPTRSPRSRTLKGSVDDPNAQAFESQSGTSESALRLKCGPRHRVRTSCSCAETAIRAGQPGTPRRDGRSSPHPYRAPRAGARGTWEHHTKRDEKPALASAWLAKESVRDIYLTEDAREAKVLLDRAIIGCRHEVEVIRSLGDTLERWRSEILNHHRTGASNGPAAD